MRLILLVLFITIYIKNSSTFFDIEEIIANVLTRFPNNFSVAVKDIAQGLPTKAINVVRGNSTNIRSSDIFELFCILSENNIQVLNLDLKTQDNKNMFYGYLKKALDISEERTSLILCEPYDCEIILQELTDNNLIHRTITYLFYWPTRIVSEKFLSIIREAMRVVVITNPRESVDDVLASALTSGYLIACNRIQRSNIGLLLNIKISVSEGRALHNKDVVKFRVYYNQASPDHLNQLSLVNWWSGRLYKSPLLPPADKVYQDFKGRVFVVPVLHAPPWHFVCYNNDSTVDVTGGRDDTLLALIAKKLNFRYEYYDPPERSQGSSIAGNGTFKGTLGLIWKRQADFFIGDVTMTWERLQAVEFSFLTLADSGAFLTHSPAKLSETLAIIRPFRWEVWPLLLGTLLISGPALWLVIAAPEIWQRRRRLHLMKLLKNCCWFTTTLFLRQSSSKEPSKTHKARLLSVLFSLGATYVIGDMYSANLTSLLARPAREQPIGTLQMLEEAMRNQGYELVVERHSSSLAILQNGTGVYGRLARLMKRQRVQRVRSVEVGVRLVLSRRKVAVLGGRETLYYDTERFGSHNFHMSEKLYTRYSAIALQIGSPYLETFNNVIMTLFEAGILTKITTDEYENLPEHSRRSDPVTESDRDLGDVTTADAQGSIPSESTRGLKPVSLRMLRGAFCLLGIGHLLAILVLAVEIQCHRRARKRELLQARARRGPGVIAVARAKIVIRRALGRATRVVAVNLDRAFGPAC